MPPILSYSQREKLNNIIIVVESFMDLPDPEASAIALSILSKYIGFPLDTEELLKEAEEVRERELGDLCLRLERNYQSTQQVDR